MQYLPHTLVHLQNLVNLNISGNKLCSLPISLGKLHNLKFLTASKNRLIELPASLRYLNLDTIDIYGNPLSRPFGLITDNATDRVPLLKEIASANCVRRRLHPTAADIPLTLVNYVNAWLKCPCGRICYESHILACIPLNISSLATSFVKSDVGTVTPALATLCSKKCYNKYSSKQQVINLTLFLYQRIPGFIFLKTTLNNVMKISILKKKVSLDCMLL